MAWPTPQEYNEAIQNPASAFADPELRGGVPEQTALGLPRPVTGNFASVYRLRCGRRDWAVRCFWREYDDMRERYAAIGRTLSGLRLPYTVSFDYLPQGIKVRGSWYPILKMEWLEGPLLHEFVESHLDDRPALSGFSRHWRDMVLALERAGLAHGDLQHGNVIVVGDKPRLVDYDGMFVPDLAGRQAHELGHPNYQHPDRTESDFGLGLDRFSACVVYASLRLLAREPRWWQELNGGDECLLFRRSDFITPEASAVFAALNESGSPELQDLAAVLRRALDSPAMAAPALSVLNGHHARPGRMGAVLAPMRDAWVRVVPSAPATVVPAAAPAVPAWLADHVSAQKTVPFEPAPLAPRLAAGGSPLGALALYFWGAVPVGHSMPIALGCAVGSNVLVWLLGYSWQPAVRDVRRLLRRRRRLLQRIARLERAIRQVQEAAGRDRQNLEATVERAARARDRCRQELRRMLSGVESIYQEIGSSLQEDVRSLREDERSERADCLRNLQESHVIGTLRRARLLRADLPEVRWTTRMYLWVRGVRSAADVSPEHAAALKRLESRTARAIVAWRLVEERRAVQSRPSALTPRESQKISARYAGPVARAGAVRGRLDRAVAELLARLQQDLSAADRLFQVAEDNARTHYDTQRHSLDERREKLNAELSLQRRTLERVESQLGGYRLVSFRRYARAVFSRRATVSVQSPSAS